MVSPLNLFSARYPVNVPSSVETQETQTSLDFKQQVSLLITELASPIEPVFSNWTNIFSITLKSSSQFSYIHST